MKDSTKNYLKRFANQLFSFGLILGFIVLMLMVMPLTGFMPPAVALTLISLVAIAITSYVPEPF